MTNMEQTEIIITKEQRKAIKAAWKESKYHDATDHIIYNALRGLPLDRGFTPISSENWCKINSNGDDRWYGFNNARLYAYGRLSRLLQKGTGDMFDQDAVLRKWGIIPSAELIESLKKIPRNG